MKTHKLNKDIMAQFMRDLAVNHRLIFELGMATGLRISDIITLKKDILDIEKPTITEKKTGKKRRIYIPKALREDLTAYAKSSNNEFIFYSNGSKSGHISRQAVFKGIKRVARKYGLDKKDNNIAPHSMRVSYACKLLEKGKSLKYIKGKLNHTHYTDTLRYLIDAFSERR